MSIEDAANAIGAKYQGSGKGSTKSYNSQNPFALFLQSLASSAGPELIGHDASPEVEKFREENPIGGLTSQLAGFAIPYVGVAKAATLPKIASALDKVGDANTVLGSAKRSATTFGLGVEAPRVTLSAATGGDVGETLQEAGFNTGLELAFGGLGGYFRAAGKAKRNTSRFGAGIDLKQPPQVIAQDLRKNISEGKIAPEEIPHAENLLVQLEESILNEAPEKAILAMESGDAQPLNRLFKTGLEQKSPIGKKLFTPGSFESPQELDSLLESSGLKGIISYVQFPRFLSSSDENGAKALESSFKQGGLRSVGENILLGKEKDGLYIVAKKLEGEVGRGATGDSWALFKTSSPGKFAKEAQDWGDEITKRNAWLVEKPRVADPENPLDIFDEAQALAEAMPISGFYQATKGRGAKTLDALENLVGIDGENEAMRRLRATFRENFAPAMYEFKSNPRAQWVFAQAKAAFQKAESLAHAMTYGDEALGKGANLYSKLAAQASLSGKFGINKSFAKILEPLDDKQISEFVHAIDQGLEGETLKEAFAKGKVSKAVHDALLEMNPLDEYLTKQTQGTLLATDSSSKFSPIKGHYMLPRTWKGTWRVPLKNENGRLIYMASGDTREGALREAKRILETPDAKGWKQGPPLTADSTDDIALALQVAVGSPEYMTAAALKAKLLKEATRPSSFKVRTGVGGYENQFTKDELISKFYNNISARQKYLAEESTNKILGEQLVKLNLEDAQLGKELQRRLDSLAGKQGPINKVVNHELDKIFAPSLGKNSASKIAGTLNEVNHHLTLGAFNLAFPVINALTFVQTVLPRVAFTVKATDESLMKAYSWLPLIGTDRKVRGSFGTLEPLKIIGKSFKEMARPDGALSKNFSKALREGVVDPKFVEEWSGQNAKQILALRATLTGDQSYSNFIRAVSNYLPSQTEKLARGNAFTVGHILGRDMFKLQDDALYRFAKEFTEKTMYNYSTADRPRVFTGPLGSVFGQFKTWTSHYLANMLEYASEGFNYGNWSPFMWQLGGTTALGGVSATALYPVAEQFNDWLSDKSLMENLYERFGGGSGDSLTGNFADGVFHGAPMFLGVSLSGQSSDPLSDPSRTASMLFSFVQAQRASNLSKAVGQLIDNYSVTGEHPINSEETRNLFIQALAPKTFARAVASTHDQAIKSMNNGNKLYSGLNIAERIMYSTGFMPKRIALMKEVNEEIWKDQEELKTKISTMGRIWSEAELAGDFDLLTRLQQEALTQGIPLDRVISSAKTQTRNAEKPQIERKNPSAALGFKSLNIIE